MKNQPTVFDALTSKPGEFRVRCHLGVIVKEHLATPEQKAEAKRQGLQRRFTDYNSRGKPVWFWAFPVHDDVFETTDREAYQAHLAEFHNGGVQKLSEPWLKLSPKLWTGPRLRPEGKPFTDRDSTTGECPTCGLVGDSHGEAGELWWREHLEGCALITAGAAS